MDLEPGGAGGLPGAVTARLAEFYHNAVAILHEVSDYELRVRLQDPDFAARVREVLRLFEAYMNDQHTWAHEHAPGAAGQPGGVFLGGVRLP